MFKERCLEGRTAIVTGGGTGLGLSMALKFADLGANLVIASRSLEHVEAATERVRARGTKALAVSCDVRNFEEVEAMMERAEKDSAGSMSSSTTLRATSSAPRRTSRPTASPR